MQKRFLTVAVIVNFLCILYIPKACDNKKQYNVADIILSYCLKNAFLNGNIKIESVGCYFHFSSFSGLRGVTPVPAYSGPKSETDRSGCQTITGLYREKW